MKKLLLVLFILLVPGLSSGGEEIDVMGETATPTHGDSALPDVFFFLAHTCETATTDCLPDNLVSNPFAVYLKVWAPSTQSYTRHYIVTDTEGALVGYASATGVLTIGTNHLSVTFSLTAGKVYRFIGIVAGADGKAGVSDPYTFKVTS